MNQRTILSVIVVGSIVLLGAGCTKKTPSATNSPTIVKNTNSVPVNAEDAPSFDTSPDSQAAPLTITLTANGLSSKSVNITRGTIVYFQNNDTVEHRIASDPHPDHSGLPGFDSLVGIPAGEKYTYIFSKVGTFKYHDHLRADDSKFNGTVVVQAK